MGEAHQMIPKWLANNSFKRQWVALDALNVVYVPLRLLRGRNLHLFRWSRSWIDHLREVQGVLNGILELIHSAKWEVFLLKLDGNEPPLHVQTLRYTKFVMLNLCDQDDRSVMRLQPNISRYHDSRSEPTAPPPGLKQKAHVSNKLIDRCLDQALSPPNTPSYRFSSG